MSEPHYDDIGEVMDQILAQTASGLCVCKIGRVERYDDAKKVADVQPLYMRIVDDDLGERAVAPKVIPSVPVARWGCGALSIDFPLQRGDTVLLIFADHSLDRMIGTKLVDPLAMKDPGALRSHHASDAIAIPISGSGLDPVSGAPTIKVKRDGVVEIGGTNRLVTKAEFEAHVHATGAGPTEAPTVPITGTSKLRG